MSQRKIILIAGPTASGKSALALNIARKSPSVIINADAMQIYQGLPLLTAQPSKTAQEEIPHVLYSHFKPAEASSAAHWLQLALGAISFAEKEQKTPLLVGGTGLYFKALLGGLSEIPPIPEEVRERTNKLYTDLGEDLFREKLKKLDPESAERFSKNDKQRSIRAYEVVLHTGKPLGFWFTKKIASPLEGYEIERHLLMPERAVLYDACDIRFSEMLERGAIEEAKNILKENLDPELPIMKTIGLREIKNYLDGKATLSEAKEKGQQATRNYAKRQMTWFRNQWSV